MFLVAIQECSSQDLAMIMQFVKKTLLLIQIIAPILLAISLVLNLTKLVSNPDNKKLLPKVRNSIIAALVLFFIPTIVTAFMGMLSNDYQISACWNETVERNYKTPSYVGIDDDSKKSTVITSPDDYQKGTPKPAYSPTTSTSPGTTSPGFDGQDPDGLHTTPGIVSGDVEVHFINPNSRVDAIYIKAGGQSIFVDGGFKNDSKGEMAYLDRLGVTHIDYYLGSHSHQNHVEAAPPIIQKYGIKKVLVGRETCNGSGSTYCSWHAIRTFANAQKVSLDGVTATALKPGDVFYLGGLKITCLGPIDVNNNLERGATAQNYNSLILRLDYGSTSFMLTGDNSSTTTVKKINSAYPGMLNVDVLKNAHHNGCAGDSVYQLYNAEYVVFTTRYDYLPSSGCINTIKKYGAKNYYIVAKGYSESVLFTSDGTTIKAYDHYNS